MVDIQGERYLCNYLKSILKDLKLNNKTEKGRKTQALKTALMHKDENGKHFDNSFRYRSVIEKMDEFSEAWYHICSTSVHQIQLKSKAISCIMAI